MAYQTVKLDESIANVHAGGVAGVDLLCGDLVYMDSDGKWQKAQATVLASQSKKTALAIMWKNGQTNLFVAPVKTLTIKGFTGLTTGGKLYLSATAGQMSQTHPGDEYSTQVVGIAVSATEVLVDIDLLSGVEESSQSSSLVTSIIDEEIEMDGSASNALSKVIPANAVILSARANLNTLITATTAVKVGIGIASNPDKYGKTGNLIKNSKITTVPSYAVIASAETVKVFAVDTSGSAAGTLDTGTVRVRLVYTECDELSDA